MVEQNESRSNMSEQQWKGSCFVRAGAPEGQQSFEIDCFD